MLAQPDTNLSDTELVKSCQAKERCSGLPSEHQTAFRELYRRYQRRVRSTLYQLCGESMLDDLVQEVFFRAWKGLPKLRNPKTFSTWLYRICWNVACDQRRAFAQLREQNQILSQQEPLHNSVDLNEMHYQALVQEALQALSFEQRAVIVLHDLEDVPQKDIAHILDIPTGTVKSRLFHARKALRDFLQQQGVVL
ncbi:MAG: sigma-70 family RNA polymerase sigma factor [Cyanobacteria bacterium]|nr:sigma-70 family RNA polymerase sigma factor [Cyanobacteria bacterium GSL.Bin21]